MQGVILAAGASSRFWPLNTRHKSLLRIGGKSLLERTLDGLADAGVSEVVIVQGPDEQVADEVSVPDGITVRFVVQPEPRGMGNALEQAREHLTGRFVVTGPYRIGISDLLDTLTAAATDDGGAVAGVETEHPERYGMLDIDGDRAVGITEKPEPDEAPSRFKVVSTYLLDADFFDHLDAVETHEYHFEDALDAYMDEKPVGFAALDEALPSLKYPWDALDFADRILEEQEPHVSDDAEVADSAVIDGNVVIEDGTRVYEHAVVRGPCYIGPDCTIGNGAVVRSGTVLEAGGAIGAHAEVRGSVIQDGFSMHAGFVGDSIIGRDVSIGAGAVVANRRVREDGDRPDIAVHLHEKDETVDTGRDRLGIMVGDDTDIGTQANLMPGVCIGSGTFIGPSAMIRHNVGDHKTYFTQVEGREQERR